MQEREKGEDKDSVCIHWYDCCCYLETIKLRMKIKGRVRLEEKKSKVRRKEE